MFDCLFGTCSNNVAGYCRRKGTIQFPYGSSFNILGNSVISQFPSFYFIMKIRFVLYLFFILKMRSCEPSVKHPSALFSCLRNRVPH